MVNGQSGRISVKRLRPQPASSTRPPGGTWARKSGSSMPQHGRVQLEQERLDRRVAVAGVHSVVVGAQHLGVGDLGR